MKLCWQVIGKLARDVQTYCDVTGQEPKVWAELYTNDRLARARDGHVQFSTA